MMHWQAMQFITTVREALPQYFYGCDVLEVGSYIVNDTVRELFATTSYVGIDLCEGPGVDVISSGDAYKSDNLVDVVISCECFEHNPNYLNTFKNMYENLKPGGLLLFTCASEGRPEHGTLRTSPDMSPGTISVGMDYYKNLSEHDFRELQIAEYFDDHIFVSNKFSHDLYFAGYKKSSESVKIIPKSFIKNALADFELLTELICTGSDFSIIEKYLSKYKLCPQLLFELIRVENRTGVALLKKVQQKILSEGFMWTRSTAYYIVCAELLIRDEEYWNAISALFQAINIDPKREYAHFLIGSCFEKLGMYDKTLESWERIGETRNTGLLLRLGTLHQQTNNLASALKCFEKCVEIEPDNPIFIYKYEIAIALVEGRLDFSKRMQALIVNPETPLWIKHSLESQFKESYPDIFEQNTN